MSNPEPKKKPMYPLPEEDVPNEDVPPSQYPNPNSQDRLKKELQERWNKKHHTADKVNIKNPRRRVKRSDR